MAAGSPRYQQDTEHEIRDGEHPHARPQSPHVEHGEAGGEGSEDGRRRVDRRQGAELASVGRSPFPQVGGGNSLDVANSPRAGVSDRDARWMDRISSILSRT